MKEQKIIIEIGHDGRITADANGFSGDTCLQELERLLDGLTPGTAEMKRKADEGKATISRSNILKLGRQP